MITRLWRGWTAPEDADAYERFLLAELFPSMRSIAGFIGADVLRRPDGDEVAFVTLTRFDSLDAIRAFAGEDHELAVLEPAARALLSRHDERALHFETATSGRSAGAPARTNRSIPRATVIPVLIYPDVREAVAWLGAAFGFVERLRIGERHRSQLSVGDGAVIIADVRGDRVPPQAGAVTHSVTVRVEDVRAHCERARAHGALIVGEPTDHQFGERQYAVADFAGHRWTFSQTLEDVHPERWGGELLTPE